jgi:signal-transduction protein with cAMP-binding, CBS, and nucleotidyltransferase domain
MSAHRRDHSSACSFCDCDSYAPDPFTVEHAEPKNPDEVWVALETLARNPAFKGLTPLHLTAMAQHGHKRLFMAGSVLMEKGDSSDKLFLLLKGEVKVEREPQGALPALHAQLGPGDIVGEVGLLHGMRHTATVTAMDDLRVLEIGRDDIQAVFHENHALLMAFLRMTHNRIKVEPTGARASGDFAAGFPDPAEPPSEEG